MITRMDNSAQLTKETLRVPTKCWDTFMNPQRRTLTFDGCRNRTEAEDQLREFLRDIAIDAERQITTNALFNVDGLDVDQLDALLTEMHAAHEHAADHVVAQFHRNLYQPDSEIGEESLRRQRLQDDAIARR